MATLNRSHFLAGVLFVLSPVLFVSRAHATSEVAMSSATFQLESKASSRVLLQTAKDECDQELAELRSELVHTTQNRLATLTYDLESVAEEAEPAVATR